MKYSDTNEKNQYMRTLNKERSDENLQRSQNDYSKSPRDKQQQIHERASSAFGGYQVVDTFFLTGWGSNKYGQLAIQNEKVNQSLKKGQQINQFFNERVTDVSAGESHTMILLQRQELYAIGSNQYGQLGIEGLTQTNIPKQIPVLKEVIIAKVCFGTEHTFAITTKGEVFSWGLNLKGQLGLGHWDNQYSPQLVYSLLPQGTSNSKAQKVGESMMHKRMKSANDLRLLNDEGSPRLKERSNSIDNIMEQSLNLKMGAEKLKPKVTVNKDQQQQTAQYAADLSILLLQSDEAVIDIACGSLHTLVLTNKNRLFSTGYGETFALGHQDTITLCEFKQITTIRMGGLNQSYSPREDRIEKIACGLGHSGCIINGKAFIWGIFGMKEQMVYKLPTLINNFGDQGIQNSQHQIIKDIALGDCLTIFLTQRGEVYIMGENTDYQLSLSKDVSESIERPFKINLQNLVVHISCGRNYCMAITDNQKQIIGWGSNNFGQITSMNKFNTQYVQIPKILNIQAEPVKIICGSYHTLILSNKPINLQETFQGCQEDVEEDLSPIDYLKKQQREEIQKYKDDIERVNKINLQLQNDLKRQQDENEKINKDMQNWKKKFVQDTQIQQQKPKMLEQKVVQTTIVLEDMLKFEDKNSPLISSRFQMQQQQQQQCVVQKQSSKFDLENTLDKLRPRTFNQSLEIDYNEIVIMKQISEGGYGIIYQGKWRETIVAIKKFKIEGNHDNQLRDFLSECHAMEALRHPNIVQFLGACTKTPNFCIVLEFCSKGSLWGHLQNLDYPLSWDDRRKIALDAAKGVHYLHMSNPPILHRDLKSLNLLLDDSLKCKLADFGWTRSLANYMTGKIGTYQWMAPEVILGQQYTQKADVFSFGIILWEIASRAPPYKEISGQQVSIEVSQRDLRPPIPKKTPPAFEKLIKMCWDRDPNKRPTFKEIIDELEQMPLPIPPK